MKTQLTQSCLPLVLTLGLNSLMILNGLRNVQAAIYRESGGIVVVEAEHFDARKADATDDHHWHVVPDDDGKDPLADVGDPPFVNARGGKYIQSLPDSAGGGQNQSQPGDVGTEPWIDYKVQITTPGRYQLYLLWGGYDGSSDSMYAEIVELRDGPGGKANDWYRYARTISNNDFATSWQGVGGPELNDASGGDVATAWDIPSAGTYTIRLGQREDGSVVDALILQLANLPAPGTPGPAESAVATSFITLTQQPADVAVATGQTATFTVAATGSSTPAIQWQKAPAGSTNFVDVAGATSASFTTSALAVADNAVQYRAVLSIPGLTINSRTATLTVDVNPPVVYRAVGSATFDKVTVVFSEAVSPATATNVANYSIAGLTISGATLAAGGSNVVLTTSLQKTGTVYSVTVKDIRDLVTPANLQAPNPTTVDFTGWVLSKGGALHKFWENITPNNIDALRNDPRFPEKPTFTTVEPAFEYPANGGNEAGSNYGNQLVALLNPPTTGDYVFFCSGDDPVELYLSTDENPANKKLIAREPQWNNARQWLATDRRDSVAPENRSDTFAETQWPTGNKITLTAGKLYYLETLHTEGGGGDSVGATWKLPGAAADPANNSPPIAGQFLSTYMNPDVSTATVAVSSPAENATFPVGANITINATATDPKGPIRKVEFLLDGKKIGESTAAPYTFTLNNAAAGRYALTAAALDRQGYVVPSPAVKIVVGTPPPEATLIVGSPPGNTSEADIVKRLQTSGFVVNVIDDDSAVPANVNEKALILVSSTTGSGNITKYRDVAVPIIDWEWAAYDGLGMAEADGQTIDNSETQIEIVDSKHPLAAGLPAGLLTLFPAPAAQFASGEPVPSASIVAKTADGSGRAALFAFEKGAALSEAVVPGLKAPARRVGIFLGGDTFRTLNADGLKIFDASVKWAANISTNVPPPAQPKFNAPVLQGSNLTLSWTGTGRLQQADAVTGPWSDAANQTNPQTVPVAAGARFYRIRQ